MFSGIATRPPTSPASIRPSAPWPAVTGGGCLPCEIPNAIAPPITTHRQQQVFNQPTTGSAESTPMSAPPRSAGCSRGGVGVMSVVIFAAEVRDQFLALQVTQRVLQLHQLDEQVVLGIEAGRVHRALVIERQPLLDPAHAGAARQIEEQRGVEDDRRRQD